MSNIYSKMSPEQKAHWNEYSKNYAKTHFKSINIQLRYVEDKDIIDFLAKQPGTTADFIRNLLREKMNG